MRQRRPPLFTTTPTTRLYNVTPRESNPNCLVMARLLAPVSVACSVPAASMFDAFQVLLGGRSGDGGTFAQPLTEVHHCKRTRVVETLSHVRWLAPIVLLYKSLGCKGHSCSRGVLGRRNEFSTSGAACGMAA